MTFKKINAWFHLWLGIVSGIGVVILGITGCILVFEQEINSLSSPWLHAENNTSSRILPPSVLYRSVEKAFPGREIESVWYKGENRTAHFSIHEMDSTVYVNPYTAQVVAAVPQSDIFQFIKDGHYYFWFPREIGHAITGWTTLVFFLITISGLILWWPKKWTKKTRAQSFTVRWKAKFKRINYDLHNVLGFYSLLLALLIAATALMMSFAWFNNGVNWLAGADTKKPRIKALSDTTKLVKMNLLTTLDKAWHKGVYELAEHNHQEIILHFPEKPSDPIYVCTDMYKGTWRDVYLDQYTMEVLPGSNKRLRDEQLAEWINRSNYGLHVGDFAGMYTKIPYFIVSLICASLPITGFYIWWGKKRKSAKKTKPKVKQLIIS
ncbi:putative iron-regulated membrane protein [Pedobacter africanus]|uniref:Iron-regulated membrane protein n=1 Tax=Pedobacter africanus TaxID=151894 RepID=A0ACC6KS94_9SPHI|nr:PepSY-associated TM helix domain-containing protein [Pedobacter africanus]MDR6782060.1 putative iron-regulated membrane protein [Pedobacter africanus]